MSSPGLAQHSQPIEAATPAGQPGAKRVKLAWIALLMLVALLATYWNTYEAPFVFDDLTGIVGNSFVHNFPEAVKRLWSATRGLTDFTFALNNKLHGLDVRGFHVTNGVIHLLAALTLFGLVRRTLQSERLRDQFGAASTGLALAIALLWMIHPLQTQAVAYSVQRMESLMGLFFLLMLYCFRRAVDNGNRRWLVLSLISFALGARSKEVMFMAPFVVVWYDRAFVAKSWRELWNRKAYYLGIVVLTALMMGPAVLHVAQGVTTQSLAESTTGPTATQADPSVLYVKGMTPWTYLVTQPGVVAYYLRLSLLPIDQCSDYAWPIARDWSEILPGVLIVGCLLLATVWAIFRRPEWAFLGGWLFLILLPTSSIMPIQDLAVEHRMYLSLAAVITFVVLAVYSVLVRFASSSYKAWGYGLAAIALLALGGLTLARNEVYRSKEIFWRDVVTKRPDNVRGRTNLGLALSEEQRNDDAIREYHAALAQKPDYPYAYYNLGNALVAEKQIEAAVAAYGEAIRYWPTYAGAFNNLGFALSSLDRNDEARRAFDQALKLQPDYAGAYLNLGLLEAKQGNPSAAKKAYQQAITLDPNSPEAHHNLALMYSREQDWRSALEEWDLVLSLRPNYAKAHQNVGVVLMEIGQTQGALEHLREAVRLQPGDAVPLRILANALVAANRVSEAQATYQAVLEIDPQNASAEAGLAALALKAENFDDALTHLQRSLNLDPTNGDIQHELANLLVRMGRNDEASEAFAKAAEQLPKSAAVRVNAARLAERMEQPDKALALYQQAVAVEPRFAPAHFNLGYMLASQQRTKEAIDRFGFAIQLDPNYADAHFALGNALARTGRLEQALGEYQIVLRLRPNFAPAINNAQQASEALRKRALQTADKQKSN